MSRDTIFRIYSMTKPIAGVALMTFYDEGAFTLDDPVGKFIPEFKGLKVAAGDGPEGQPVVVDADHEMTIRELVSHTGGLTYGFFSRSQVDALYQQADILNRDSTLKDMVVKLGAIPLRQQPGSAWHYSVAVDVQGYLVEVLAGKPFDEGAARANLRTFGHGGHGVLGTAGEGRPLGVPLSADAGRRAGADALGVPDEAEFPVGRGWAGVHRDGLCAVLPNAPQRRRVRGRAHPRARDRGADAYQPIARTHRLHQSAGSRRRATRSASTSRSSKSRTARPTMRWPRASSGGTGSPGPGSASIPSRTPSSSA